jgi:hypothetical protein
MMDTPDVGNIVQNAENTRRVARPKLSTDAVCPIGHTRCASQRNGKTDMDTAGFGQAKILLQWEERHIT